MGDTRGRVPGSSSAHTLLQLCWEPLAHLGRRGVLLGLCPGNSSKAAVNRSSETEAYPLFLPPLFLGVQIPSPPRICSLSLISVLVRPFLLVTQCILGRGSLDRFRDGSLASGTDAENERTC